MNLLKRFPWLVVPLLIVSASEAQVLVHPMCFQSGGTAGTEATDFDGVDDYYEIDSAAQGTNATAFMASFWIKRAADGTTQQILWVKPNDLGGTTFKVSFDTADDIVVYGQNPSGTAVVNFKTSAGNVVTADGSWHHVLISFNTAIGDSRKHIYVDDASQSITTTTFTTDAVVQFASTATSNRIWIGALPFGSPIQELAGCLSEFWVSMGGDSLDISDSANRRRFTDGSGDPVYLGTDGRLATGRRPHLYFPAGDPSDNRGTDPDFVRMGDYAACSDSPN